jgi:hypothetical protein
MALLSNSPAYLSRVDIRSQARSEPPVSPLNTNTLSEERYIAMNRQQLLQQMACLGLAKAGVVEGKRVTTSTLTVRPDELEKAGAIFTDALVERDGLIITANGSWASRQLGKAVAAALGE